MEVKGLFLQLKAVYKLVYPLNLPIYRQVIQGGAGGTSMARHVHADQVQVLWKELDHAESHSLVCRETMQHEDGRFVSWPVPEGVTELIVLMVHIADLHTQCPPPVPIIDPCQC